MRHLLVLFGLVAACGGSKPNPMTKPPEPVVPDAAVSPGLSVDAAPSDAGLPASVTSAQPFVFRYHTPARSETWTLQTADGGALLVVQTSQGTTRYEGTAQGDAIAVASKTGKLALTCKPTKRRLSKKCNDAKAPELEVRDCYVPDFKTPIGSVTIATSASDSPRVCSIRIALPVQSIAPTAQW